MGQPTQPLVAALEAAFLESGEWRPLSPAVFTDFIHRFAEPKATTTLSGICDALIDLVKSLTEGPDGHQILQQILRMIEATPFRAGRDPADHTRRAQALLGPRPVLQTETTLQGMSLLSLRASDRA